jgi:hypothetical protein
MKTQSKRPKPLVGNKAVIEADMPRAIPKFPRVPLKPGADPDHVAPSGWLSGGDRPAPGKAKAKAKRGR